MDRYVDICLSIYFSIYLSINSSVSIDLSTSIYLSISKVRTDYAAASTTLKGQAEEIDEAQRLLQVAIVPTQSETPGIILSVSAIEL